MLLDKLEALSKARGITISQMALGWLLSREQVVAVIIGANNPQQLADSLGASGVWLTNAEMNELTRMTSLTTGMLG